MNVPTLEQWLDAWPGCRPIGHELRHGAGERWVRFHSLPESRRYAEDEADYAIVLQRHLAILDNLTSTVAAPIFAVAQSWSHDADRQVAAIAPWQPWGSVPTDLDDPEEGVTELQVTQLSTADPATMVLLLLVADDETRVLFFDDSLSWLYAPYDGGADVIADPEVIARLRAEHSDWLPSNPSGL